MLETPQLIDERLSLLEGIAQCREARALGITHHGVQARLASNEERVRRIDAELARRGVVLLAV